MNWAVFAYSRQGMVTARQVIKYWKEGALRAYTVPRLAGDGFLPLPQPTAPLYEELFSWATAMIFVGSCGIAVRAVAPYVRDKRIDPAVISIDELGQFVIPLLSGHIGGANRLALELAEALGAAPVITTATDINRRFSVDAWAASQGYTIGSMDLAKAFSAAILERDLPAVCDFPVVGPYPAGVFPGEVGELGLLIGCRTAQPFEATLRIIPPALRLGIGCRKGTPCQIIAQAVETVLRQSGLDQRGVYQVASIDLKAEETGLRTFCLNMGWPAVFYSVKELAAVPGVFTSSAFVQQTTGIDNVCERAALVGGGRLLVKKTARNGVTVAVAEKNMEVRFG